MSTGDRFWIRRDDDGNVRRIHVPPGDPVECSYDALSELLRLGGFIEDEDADR